MFQAVCILEEGGWVYPLRLEVAPFLEEVSSQAMAKKKKQAARDSPSELLVAKGSRQVRNPRARARTRISKPGRKGQIRTDRHIMHIGRTPVSSQQRSRQCILLVFVFGIENSR